MEVNEPSKAPQIACVTLCDPESAPSPLPLRALPGPGQRWPLAVLTYQVDSWLKAFAPLLFLNGVPALHITQLLPSHFI